MKRFLIPVMMVLGAAPAFAQSGGNLTPELQQKVQAVRTQFQGQMKPLMQDAFATRRALRDELQKTPPDDGTLTQLENRLASDRQQLQSLHAQKQAELKRQLTPQEYARVMLRRPHFGRRMHGPQR